MTTRTLVLAIAILASSATVSSAQRFQDGPLSDFDELVGDWHGFQQHNNIEVKPNGDVMQSNAPLARVSTATRAGSNFAFSGKNQNGTKYTCFYYITFLHGDSSDWDAVDQDGEFDCPTGLYVAR